MSKAFVALVVETLGDSGLLDVFIVRSINEGLISRYAFLERSEFYPPVIRAQISQILCETGNRALPVLAMAITKRHREKVLNALTVACDCFGAAIAFERNQLGGYVGLAQAYAIIGEREKSQEYAELGLSLLAEVRNEPYSKVIARGESSLFPPDIDDQIERELRTYLAVPVTDPVNLRRKQAANFHWKQTAQITEDGQGRPWTRRSIRYAREKEEAVLWLRDATVTLVREDVAPNFDNFFDLEQWITAHPRSQDDNNPTGERLYLREIERFVTRHGYSEQFAEVTATDKAFFMSVYRLEKAGYAVKQHAKVVAALILDALYRYEEDRSGAILFLTDLETIFKQRPTE